MTQKRVVTESHGDYEYTVEQAENGVVRSFRKLLTASADVSRTERIPSGDLPSESLKEAFASYTGKTRAELSL